MFTLPNLEELSQALYESTYFRQGFLEGIGALIGFLLELNANKDAGAPAGPIA